MRAPPAFAPLGLPFGVGVDPAQEDRVNDPESPNPSPEAAPAAEAAAATAEPAAQAAAEADLTADAPVGRLVTDYASNRAFADFPLSPEVLSSILEKGYSTATSVQAAAIEPALAGKDLVVRSKTGTGKTAAFSIPVVERIPAGERKTRAIILTPTRELARQVAEECEGLSKNKDLRVACIYGGVGFGAQEDALKAGAEVVVGTPGRILDHIRRRNLDLSGCTFAVLDEADEMLGMGFYEDVTKILDQTPETRQCLFFSATVDDRVRSLIHRYAKEPLDIRLSTDTDKVDGIQHVLYETTPDFHKARALLAILDQEEPKSAIIFVNTREDAATVATYLSRQGLDAELLSGELPQNKREQVMARVKRGETQFLVATDVAARGIDISDLSHVINYSLPEDPAVYLHRTGRTGRIGKKGIAISLASGSELNQRNTLERQYQIGFLVKRLPTAEEAARARVDRQARAIQAAMGTMAFEGYIGTARALRDRPDGDIIIAAALRAFFLWDRMRKAENNESAGSIEALEEVREEKRAERREERGERRDGDRRSDRSDRRDGDRRSDRGDRRDDRGDRRSDRGDRRDGDRRDGDRRDGDRRRDDRGHRQDRPREDRSEGEPVAVESAAPGGEPGPSEGATAEGGERRRRRRDRDRRDRRDPEPAHGESSAEGAPLATEPEAAAEGASSETSSGDRRRRRRRRSPRGEGEGSDRPHTSDSTPAEPSES
jgi:ATP-dependent RNA helicase DeaD